MANIVLEDKDGNQVVHRNRTTATFDTEEGGTAIFSEGETQQKTVTLDMASGNQSIVSDSGKLLNSVTVTKPDTLIPGNIKKGVTIGGVSGTYAGIVPSGNADITDLSEVDVTDKATARISALERDKIIPANIAKGVTVLGVTGMHQGGTDTSDATAKSDDIYDGKTAYVDGLKITGTLSVNSLIREGDTLTTLYFSGDDSILYDFATATGISERTELSILQCGDSNASNRLALTALVTFVSEGTYDIDIVLQIYQNGTLAKTIYISPMETVGVVDISSYTLPAVSYVLSKFAQYIVSKQPLKFGVDALARVPFRDGGTVTDLYFNTEDSELSTQLSDVLATLTYNQTSTSTGLNYTVLGLDHLCAADLSSVGLGNGYIMYWDYDITLIYSTIAFDGSAYIPGLKVTTPGWQTEKLHLTTNTGNGVTVAADSFLPLIWNARHDIMSTEKYGTPKPLYIGASGSTAAAIPANYSVNEMGPVFDTTTLKATRLSNLVLDVSALQLGMSKAMLNFHDFNSTTGFMRFAGYSIDLNGGTYAVATLTYDSTNNTLTLTGANMGGVDMSTHIPNMQWEISVISN